VILVNRWLMYMNFLKMFRKFLSLSCICTLLLGSQINLWAMQDDRRPKSSQPGTASPQQGDQLPPNAGTETIRPNNEALQSNQPQTNLEQQRRQTTPSTQDQQPISPQVQPPSQEAVGPGGTTSTVPPNGATTAPTNGLPSMVPSQSGTIPTSPNQSVGASSGIAPATLPQDPPTIAPNYEAPLRPLPSAERVGVSINDSTSLSLNDAIVLALKNNNDIETARIDVGIAEQDLKAARGSYDPIFSSESYFERSTTPTSSLFGGGPDGSINQRSATGSLRVGGLSPFAGGSYQVDFSSTRLQTNNQFVTLNPQYPSSLTFTYTQPLFRGRGIDDTRRRIEVAKKNLSLTDAQFRQRVVDIITRVQRSYWDLAFALRNLQVQIDAVKQARRQYESNQRLVQQGILAPIDIVAAQTQITTFEQNVYTAQEAVTRAENELKTLLLSDRNTPLWSNSILPVTPITLEPPRETLEQAVKSALTNRPEILQLTTSSEINEINNRFYRDRTKPQVDLVGSYNAVGLAGTVAERGPSPFPTGLPVGTVSENLVGGYNQSLSNLIGQDYPTVRVGVRLSLPLRNRTAEANLARSLAEGKRIENQRAQIEQIIEADVRNTLQSIKSAEARLASAAAARSSAEQQYESEQRQFQAGLTTVFLVLQRQTELTAARGRELQAQTDLNKAIAEYQRATSLILQLNNIDIK
jgi:outer membrane protein TolC